MSVSADLDEKACSTLTRQNRDVSAPAHSVKDFAHVINGRGTETDFAMPAVRTSTQLVLSYDVASGGPLGTGQSELMLAPY